MDPLMLTSITLLARREGWHEPTPTPRRARLAPLRMRLATALRALAVRIEPVRACDAVPAVAAR
ncbi:hypothetical protein [Agrococcus sp. SGAir0287]|uniref:hypothetical protein n=1 Tax=Agrococcus sp. SGAir0287 TaxID=2070347 RepID=UPI001585D8FE|nr:hypothetical protein [Agrococcus sp. SGAir0287]